MRSGALYRRARRVPAIDEIASSSSLMPTPTVERVGQRTDVTFSGDGATLLPTPAANDSGNTPENHLRKKPGRKKVTSLAVMARGGLLPTPRTSDSNGGGSARRRRNGPPNGCDVATDTDGERTRRPAQEQAGSVLGRGAANDDLAAAWGDYGPAIERWEHVLGRAAPAPIDEKGRLNVPFVEWMQGFDVGWVDDLKRSPALHALGNAVVQQQGALALSMLLEAP